MVAIIQSREPIIERLGALIGPQDIGLVPPCVFVHGPKSSGKTWVVSNVLRASNVAHAMIPAQFCHFSKDFLDYVTREIWIATNGGKRRSKRRTEEEPPEKAQSGEELLALQKQLSSYALDGPKFCLVFDDAEFFLFHEKRDMLATFMALQEITARNVCVVLISSSPWERFLHKRLPCVPLTLTVPQFELDAALAILSATVRRLKTLDDDVFMPVLKNIVKAVFPVTRNISDIKLMVESVLGACKGKLLELQEEVTKGKEAGDLYGDMRPSEMIQFKSFQIAAPHIKEAVQRVHLREVRQSQGASDLNLPVFGQYLLIAAFIASYSSPKWDKIFFAKRHAEGKRKTKFAVDKKYSETTGPQFFNQSRLMYIFHVIYETAHPDDKLESLRRFSVLRPLVTTMERSGLLYRGSQDLLFNPKYKCIATARLVIEVAKNINFNLGMYVRNLSKL